jgi:deoxyadenosine/deoxycytidine kinase
MSDIILIGIDGNIGATKSTMINVVKGMLSDIKNFVEFMNTNHTQPIEKFDPDIVGFVEEDKLESKWRIDGSFDKFYEDKEKYGYEFQVIINNSIDEEINMLIKQGKKIIIIDRTIYARNNVFGKINCPNYLDKLNKQYKNYKITQYFYIATSPIGCLYRAKKRNRKGEHIDIEYLTNLHNEYENLFNQTPNTTRVDFTNFQEDIPIQLINGVAKKIINFIKNKK